MEVTWHFNRYFINNNNKKKINIIIIFFNDINIDNNNNSNEDLDKLLITEPQYRFRNSMHVIMRKLLHFVLLLYASTSNLEQDICKSCEAHNAVVDVKTLYRLVKSF